MAERIEYRNAAGRLHKEDGPAVIHGDYMEWWVNGELHKEDGPAVIDDNGAYQGWYMRGKCIMEVIS